jgi:hypothetical protein
MERAESLKQELDMSHAAEQDLNSQLEAAKKVSGHFFSLR